MLFDTLKRKNKAEQEEQEWNANRPADYVSQNKEAMDALTGEIGSGYDGSELAKAYQQYRDQTADAAAAGQRGGAERRVRQQLGGQLGSTGTGRGHRERGRRPDSPAQPGAE